MNSEELELSLRTEFESHLKNVVADMRQEFSQLQEKVEAEFDKHKSQLDAVFQEFSARFENNKDLEVGFSEMVVEHLRLARDEGARISATAFAAAEEMEAETAAAAPPTAGVNELSSAISDIIAQDSQATILKSLVHHAAQFTPRGAFFIIKNEHFVGWRVFGKEGDSDEQAVREVFFPVASATALGESVRSLSPVESSYGTYSDDSIYLNKLEFGHPERMYAIPLIARGRGVAVLYADYGTQGEEVNVEALETLVRVAGLTVEVLAGAPVARTSQDFHSVSSDYVESRTEEIQEEKAVEVEETAEEMTAAPIAEEAEQSESVTEEFLTEAEDDQSAVEEFQPPTQDFTEEFQSVSDESFGDVKEFENVDYHEQPVPISEYDLVDEFSETSESQETPVQEEKPADETFSWGQPAESEETAFENTVQPDPSAVSENGFSIPQEDAYLFDKSSKVEETVSEPETAPQIETPSFDQIGIFPAEESFSNGKSEMPAVEKFEPVVSTPPLMAPSPVRSRFSDRNVDLPIEVGEDERRLHNDARRFARLLVSEIKLYNEQKVKEGRESQDLYDRLREAIDRSRDMYDKRVQPPVAAKFDYFHYELVSSLAEGEEGKLGGGYPGKAV